MLAKDEEKELIGLVGKMGNEWTPELYNALAPKFALTAIETVFLREHECKTKVLLLQRSSNDAYYPNQWHSPGTMLRASDVTHREVPSHDGFNVAFDRVVNLELKVKLKSPPQQIKSIFHYTPRGPEIALIFLCELDGEPTVGQFFNTDALPFNLIEHHWRIITIAIGAYEKILSIKAVK